MNKIEKIKDDIISYSVASLKFTRTVLDYGISILERTIDDKEKVRPKKKKDVKRAKRIDIE